MFDETVFCLFHAAVKQGSDIKSMEQMNQEDIYSKGLFKSAYGKKMKVGQRWVEQMDDDWVDRKFERIFQSMADPSGYSVDMAIELAGNSKSRRYGTSLSYGVGDYGKSHRGSLMMEKRLESESEDNFVFCVDVDAKLPQPSVVRREELLRDDTSRSSTIKIGFGKSCTDDRKIVINVINLSLPKSFGQIGLIIHHLFLNRLKWPAARRRFLQLSSLK